MHWQIGKGGGFHYAAAEAAGAALPVTVFLGGPPALVLAAIAPLPENVPELMLASLLAGRRLDLTAGPGPHPLVASAEFALVGQRARPRRRRPEGPFGDHYGYYSLAARLSRCSRWRRSRAAATRSIRRRWSASRARRTSTSATSCRSCSPRSSRS